MLGEAELEYIEQLKQAQFDKIAMGDPEAVPAGVYARKYLERMGMWDELNERVVPAVNVRAALALVASGAAPVGIVYQTDAAINNQVQIAFPVTDPNAPRIVYPVAMLQQSESKLEAGQFLEYCNSPDGKKIFEQYGFVTLPNGGVTE